MKYLFIVIISCLLFSSSYAQTNNFPANGYVTIGAQEPVEALTIGEYGGSIALRDWTTSLSGTSSLGRLKFYDYYGDAASIALEHNYRFGGVPRAMLFSVNGAERLRIISNGNVGIGTKEPVEALTIGEYGGSIALRDWTTSLSGTSSLGRLKFYDYHGDAASIALEHNYYFGGTPRAMLFSVNGAERLRIISNGNVGIGTDNPDSKLSVKGNIRAQEIKVEANNWPDYVFTKEYKLPTLQDTENHIKEKGHLLGIPSAKEVEANGIDLGEMNAKLLQKIEELTLYLINQDKTNEEQNQTILGLMKKVDNQQIEIKKLQGKQ